MVEKMLRILCVLMLIAVGCGKKVEIEKQPETKTEVVQESKQETQPKRSLKVKESHVLTFLNAKLGERMQFKFTYSNQLTNGRQYFDAERKTAAAFFGDNENISIAMINMACKEMVDELNSVENITMFLDAGDKLVLGVAPSIVKEADGWLSNNLAQVLVSEKPTSVIINGFELAILRESDVMCYSISSAD